MTNQRREAKALYMNKFADCGPGQWWFVDLGDGRLIEVGDEHTAVHMAEELNAGRAALEERT